MKDDVAGLPLESGVAETSCTEGQRGKEMRTFLYLCLPFSKDRIEIIVFLFTILNITTKIGIFVNK